MGRRSYGLLIGGDWGVDLVGASDAHNHRCQRQRERRLLAKGHDGCPPRQIRKRRVVPGRGRCLIVAAEQCGGLSCRCICGDRPAARLVASATDVPSPARSHEDANCSITSRRTARYRIDPRPRSSTSHLIAPWRRFRMRWRRCSLPVAGKTGARGRPAKESAARSPGEGASPEGAHPERTRPLTYLELSLE
jgi:hypothetical protein